MLRPQGRRRVETVAGLATILWLLPLSWLLLAAPAGADEPAPDPATPAVVPVGDVSVTATRAERDVLDTAGHVTVIDRAAIERSGAASLPDLLRREAGLHVVNATASRTGFIVEPRGFNNGSGGGSSLLVLVDGRRINEPSTAVPDWALLHLDDVERIEVVRGPASALYGDNAVGGVVHVITRSGEGAPRGTATARLGRHRTREGSLWAGGGAGPVSLSVFADRFRSDGYREQSLFRIESFKGSLRTELGDRASLVVRGGRSSDDRDAPGPLTEAEVDDDRRQVDPDNLGNRIEVRSWFVDGVLEASPCDDVHLEIQGWFSERSDRGVDSSAFGDFDQDFRSEAIGVDTKLQVDREIAGRPWRLVAGVDLLREDRDGRDAFDDPFDFFDSQTRRRTKRKLVGAFLQNELEIFEGLLLSAGIRHDRAEYRILEIDEVFGGKDVFEPTHSVWSPRFGLVYRLAEHVSAYASWSRGFRLPNLAETSSVFASDAEIEPQRSQGFELGLKHQGPRFRGTLALYRMDVADEIVADSEVLFDFGTVFAGVQTVNLDRVRHQGVEVSSSFDLLDWLELHGSYTYDDTRVRRDDVTDLDGNRIPITPRHRGVVGLLARLPLWLELGLDLHWLGRRGAVNDFGENLETIDAYRRWDAHVAWRPLLGEHVQLAFFFDVQNLARRRYSEFGGRPTFVQVSPPPAVPVGLSFFPSPEREWVGGVSLTVRR